MKKLVTVIYLINIICTLPMLAAAESPADSSCLSDVCFPKNIQGDSSLNIRGIARYRYWGFSLYTAGLYTSALPVLDTDGLPMRQETEVRIKYLRDFTVKDFVESGEAFVKKNPAYNSATMGASLKAINDLYRPIKVGDEYEVRLLKGVGVELRLNGQKLGVAPGEDFARIYLGIWLSSKYGLDGEFSSKLMGADS